MILFHFLFYFRFFKIPRVAAYVKMMEDIIDDFLNEKHFQSIRIQFRNGFDFAKLMFQLVLLVHILAMFWTFQSDQMNHEISS